VDFLYIIFHAETSRCATEEILNVENYPFSETPSKKTTQSRPLEIPMIEIRWQRTTPSLKTKYIGIPRGLNF
jgi:hypothetical protein